MTKSKVAPKHTGGSSKPANNLTITREETESEHQATARVLVAPEFRHGQTIAQLLKANLGDSHLAPGAGDYSDAIKNRAGKAAQGDLTFASRMLAAQALTLDGIFSEMARRMALNMGDYLAATETYARIALKAQAGSRATLAELAKLHQPREQTVRHVYVNEGGQAVIADEFHNHTGGQKNGQSSEQPHATGASAIGPSPALPCPDSMRPAVPVPGSEGQSAVPNARRQGKRGT